MDPPEVDKPISVPPRPLGHVKREAAVKIVRDGIKEVIITPSMSEWLFAIVLVTKHNGEYRLRVKYRPLNRVANLPAYPLPRVHQALDVSQGKTYFSKFSLLQAYWQIPVRKDTGKYLAFITPDGKYE